MKDPEHRHRGIYLLPNAFTTAALFAGFYAIVQAMNNRFEAAAIAIFVAMVLDGMDGRVARLTNTQSAFGEQYDSLSDMTSFGVAPALVDLVGGQVTVAWLSPGAVAQQLPSGKLRPLAVSGETRWPTLPEVPTFAELGYKNVDIVPWYGLFGPKGLPADVLSSLNHHVNEVLRMPEVAERLRGLGIEPQGGAPARLQSVVDADWRSFSQRVKEFAIQAE